MNQQIKQAQANFLSGMKKLKKKALKLTTKFRKNIDDKKQEDLRKKINKCN